MQKISTKKLEETILHLIAKCSCELPCDVLRALEKALQIEPANSIARSQLSIMLQNAKIAKVKKRPICQDTGTLLFSVSSAKHHGADSPISDAIRNAVSKATEEGLLRTNTICTLTGKSHKDNLSDKTPAIEFDINPKLRHDIIRLLMKGGGSENIGTQYSLPDETLGAERDLEGVRKAIIDSAIKAQGKGCPPGAVAVCVGGDRASGFATAKKLFFRKIGERNTDPRIAKLEKSILQDMNSLGIGPQGLGGKTFALDLFIEFIPRHPASFFVTVSHMCWAWRRAEISHV
jgi:fumarate hydratase class I